MDAEITSDKSFRSSLRLNSKTDLQKMKKKNKYK